MKLIDNLGVLWHRLWTVRMAIVSTIYSSAAGAWVLLPADWQPSLTNPEKMILAGIGIALAASPGVARIISQPKLADVVTKAQASSETTP